MNRVHQGYRFEKLILTEHVRLVTYRLCRKWLDDPKATREQIESAIVVCDEMVAELTLPQWLPQWQVGR